MKTHTRHLLTLAVLLGFTAPIGAQTSAVPDQISYQGFVTDTGGNPIGNSTPENRTIVFRIWDHPTNTAAPNLIYSEQQVVTISRGEFSVLVGDGTAVTGTPLGYSETTKGKPTVTIPMAFGGTTRFIGISVYESNGGVAPEISPRQRVVSSAYAYRARFAETLGSNGGTAISTLNDGRVGVGNTNPPSLFTITGANTSTSTSTPQMVITADDVTERLRLGVDSTGNGTGFIQSFKEGTGAQNLLLNPGGGNVGINTTTPLSTLHVNGIISARTSTAAHGYVALQPGSSNDDGYIEWYKPNGSRSAFMGSSGLNNLQLTLGGTHNFLITGNGSVGIGNTAPTAKLDVTGGIKSTGGGGYTFNTGDLDGGLFSPNDGVVTLRTNNTERLRVDGSGNVGVGSSTINHRLQVSGNVMLGTGQPNLSFTPIGDTLYLGQPRKYLSTTLGTAVGGSTDWVNLMCHSLSAGIIFGGATTDATPHSNPAVYMAIKPSGNVGIGTTTPGERLTVVGSGTTSASTALSVFNSGLGTLLSVRNDGNVGIGTTTPAQKLDVIGGTQSQWLELRVNNGSSYIDFSSNTTTDYHARIIWQGTTTNRLDFEAPRFVFTGGRIGVGTTGPTCPLDVRGGTDVVLNGNYTSIRSEWFVQAFGYGTMSDQRIKQIVDRSSPVSDLDTVMKLKVTNYQMKAQVMKGNPVHKGLIAQEVEKVIPEAVLKSEAYVPEIFELAKVAEYNSESKSLKVTMGKPHGLAVGDMVMITSKDAETDQSHYLKVTQVTDEKAFVVGDVAAGIKKAFVFGKQVKDFRSVDYNRIYTTGIGAIQQIKREKDAEVKALKEENTELKARVIALEAQTQRLADLEAKDKAREAKLAAIEKLLLARDKGVAQPVLLKKSAGSAE